MNIIFLILLIAFSFITGCSINKVYSIDNDNYTKYYNYSINNKMYINSTKYTLLYYFNDGFDLNIAEKRIDIIKNNNLNKMDIYVIVLYPIENNNNIEFKNLFYKLDVFYQYLRTKKGYKNKMQIMGFSINNVKQNYNVLIYAKKVLLRKGKE